MMNEQPTQNLPNANSFEERVLTLLASMDARLQTLEARQPERTYDTKPILERILKEVADHGVELKELRAEMQVMRTEFGARFDRLEERQTALEERQTALEERQAGIEKEVRHFGRKLDMFNEELLEIRWALRDFEKRLSTPEAAIA